MNTDIPHKSKQSLKICGDTLSLNGENIATCNREQKHAGKHTASFLDGSRIEWQGVN